VLTRYLREEKFPQMILSKRFLNQNENIIVDFEKNGLTPFPDS
jgi:hypothetical protein